MRAESQSAVQVHCSGDAGSPALPPCRSGRPSRRHADRPAAARGCAAVIGVSMSWMWGVIAVLVSCSALGQQPARIVVGFPPGGSLDALARYLAEPVREALGRPVIVENRAGAAGRLAVEATKAAPPDGNTLMLVPSGPMTLFPYIFSDLRFDPLRDFSPIAQLASQDLCLA